MINKVLTAIIMLILLLGNQEFLSWLMSSTDYQQMTSKFAEIAPPSHRQGNDVARMLEGLRKAGLRE